MSVAIDPEPESEERRATFLELFLDLAFVFAVAQVTIQISSDMTWEGAGRGL